MSDHLEQLLAQAKRAGILPESAVRPDLDSRPWPVVLLTALGAWLAAIPLLAVAMLLLGDLIRYSIGPYIVGVLLLVPALIILRGRDLPVFVEQLAVPALLVAGGSLAFGLFRDLPERAAAAVLSLVVLGLAISIARPWLRVLFGFVLAGLVAMLLLPGRGLAVLAGDGGAQAWLALHGVLMLWLGALWVQREYLNSGERAPEASALESIASGWLVAVLIGLALQSGASFLLGSGFGSGLAVELLRALTWQQWLVPMVSVLLALAAGLVAAGGWASLRHPLYLWVALVGLILAWLLPTLGAVWLVLALTLVTKRYQLAGSAALAAAWIVGSVYYQLHWSLAAKALLLVACGLLLGVLAWFAHHRNDETGARSSAHGGAARWLIAASALATLLVVNVGIWQKESLIRHGQPIFVSLAPVEPRSLMQGDYMHLNFSLPPEVWRDQDVPLTSGRLHVVAQRDQRGVAELKRLHREAIPLDADEFLIELTPKAGRWVLVTDAWFFKEGDAERWEAARFGEFRVDERGRALLVGLADDQLNPIKP